MTDTAVVPVEAKPARVFSVRNFIDDKVLAADIAYSLANLSDANQRQAGLFVHYSTLAAKASRQVNDLKLVLEATESAVYRVLRGKALEADEKVTEAQLAKSVSASKRVLTIKRALNEAKHIEAIAKGAVEGFNHRRDMLVQDGATSREERKGELRVIGAADTAASLEALKERVLARRQAPAA